MISHLTRAYHHAPQITPLSSPRERERKIRGSCFVSVLMARERPSPHRENCNRGTARHRQQRGGERMDSGEDFANTRIGCWGDVVMDDRSWHRCNGKLEEGSKDCTYAHIIAASKYQDKYASSLCASLFKRPQTSGIRSSHPRQRWPTGFALFWPSAPLLSVSMRCNLDLPLSRSQSMW